MTSLITQRSLVQIQPPQPIKSVVYGDLRAGYGTNASPLPPVPVCDPQEQSSPAEWCQNGSTHPSQDSETPNLQESSGTWPSNPEGEQRTPDPAEARLPSIPSSRGRCDH